MDFNKLFNTERLNGDREAVEETTDIFLSAFTNTSRQAFVCLIQALG